MLDKLYLFNNGNGGLKCMQTPPCLMFWDVVSNEYAFMAMFPSVIGTVQSKKVSDEHTMSKL